MTVFFKTDPNEKPLDVIKDDGGLTSIFRTIAVIGDSLASGDLESIGVPGSPRDYHDMPDISWPQYLARMSGTTVYNFTRGNMTCREYNNSFADERGFWDKEKAAQAYIIALGVNDLDEMEQELGSVADIDSDFHRNRPTFAGDYAKIIQHYKEIQPGAVFFLVTMPYEEEGPYMKAEWVKNHEAHRKLLYELADFFTNTYVIDLAEYSPPQDAEFHRLFYTGGHLNSAGYYLCAKMIGSYIDYIVRHDFEKFNRSGFIGTTFAYCE
ncbi:MAG: SGNH/GDSL hydrolase family protein [Clostridia bacterium]|nr:SGNH/GDSL hydrolase family protein [Clostridia bacterium]